MPDLRRPPSRWISGGTPLDDTSLAGAQLSLVGSPEGGQLEAGIIFIVVVGSIFASPFSFRARKNALLRKAPTGSRQTVSVKVMTVEDAIRRWGKLGYDLHERSDYESSSVSPAASVTRIRIPEVRARLTFIKR